MKELFIIAIFILAAYIPLYIILKPKWRRIVWVICAFLSAGLSSPYLIEITPDNYRFIVYIALVILIIAGIAPLAEKRN